MASYIFKLYEFVEQHKIYEFI